MKLTWLLTLPVALASQQCSAANWTGALVGSECYAELQRNTKHGSHPGTVDNNRSIRYCAPSEKMKSFSIVQRSGEILTLDSDGNDKARELFLKVGKKSPYMVNVTGEVTQDTLKVGTISIAK
jgi:hypothetical protein